MHFYTVPHSTNCMNSMKLEVIDKRFGSIMYVQMQPDATAQNGQNWFVTTFNHWFKVNVFFFPQELNANW